MNEKLDRALLDQVVVGDATPAQFDQLRSILQVSEAARRQYWSYIQQQVLLEDILRESRGRDLAGLESDPVVEVGPVLPTVSDRRCSLAQLKNSGIVLLLAASLLVAVGLVVYFQNFNRPSKLVVVAQLHSLIGNVQVRSPSGDLTPATSGRTIAAGEAIVVDAEETAAEESTAEIVLVDNSRISLDSKSTLLFPADQSGEHRIHLERGGVQVQAMPQPRERPLIVTTPQARVTVLGTRFRLYGDAKASRVELTEGSVQFERQADGKTVEVAEGFFAVATQSEGQRPVEPLLAQPLSLAKCQLRHTLLRAGRVAGLSHNGRELAAATTRGLQYWDVPSGAPLGPRLKSDRTVPIGLAWTADDQTLVMLNNNHTVAVWNRNDPQPATAALKTGKVRQTAVSSDARTIVQAIGSETGEVAIFRVDAEARRVDLANSLDIKPWSVAVSGGSYEHEGGVALQSSDVVVGHWDGLIEMVDPAAPSDRQKSRVRGTPRPLAVSDDWRFIAAFANTEGLVLIHRQTDAAEVARRVLWPSNGARVASLRFSADASVLLAGMEDGLVRAWSTRTGDLILFLETGDSRLYGLDLSTDQKTLVTLGRNDSVKIWECEWPKAIEE